MRVEDQRIRGLTLHLERLMRDCHRIFDADLYPDRVRHLVRRTLADTAGSVVVRVTVFDPDLELGRPGVDAQPQLLVTTRPAARAPLPPLRLQSAPYCRELPEVKHVGLFGALRCRRVAQRNGFDDALYVAVRLLGIVARMDGTLEAVRQALPQVVNTPELRFDCDDTRKFVVIEEVAARLKGEGANVNNVDGVRVSTPDGWWLLRASNTQAVLVARAEAHDDGGLGRLKAALARQLAASGLAAPDFSGTNAGH